MDIESIAEKECHYSKRSTQYRQFRRGLLFGVEAGRQEERKMIGEWLETKKVYRPYASPLIIAISPEEINALKQGLEIDGR